MPMYRTCPKCDGTGVTKVKICYPDQPVRAELRDAECAKCMGNGRIQKESSFDVPEYGEENEDG